MGAKPERFADGQSRYNLPAPMTSPQHEKNPTRFGPFIVSRAIGQGGTGMVYAARREGEERDSFAVKVLREEIALSPKEQRRFLEEAARMRRVSHPGIVQVLEAGRADDGRPYIAMPLLTGETLAARVARGPLRVDRALAYLEVLADAVAQLHDAGLIHRDIKPENIILDAKDERPVLLDFGIAREMGGGTSTTTEQGTVRGSPAYMAPERFFGIPAGVATDTYELAVVFYQMITGQLPWRAGSGAAGRLHPTDPREAREEGDGSPIPSAMATALLRALSTRPEARPASVRELIAQLRSALDAPPSSYRTTTTDFASSPVYERPTIPPRRRWKAPLAVALASVVVLGGAALTFAGGRLVSPTTTAAVHGLAAASEPIPEPVTAVEAGAPEIVTIVEASTPPAPTSEPKGAARGARPVRRDPPPTDLFYRDRK